MKELWNTYMHKYTCNRRLMTAIERVLLFESRLSHRGLCVWTLTWSQLLVGFEVESVGGGSHWRWILMFLSWLHFACALPPDCRYCVTGHIFLVTCFPSHDGQPYTELWTTINLFSWLLSSICCLREKKPRYHGTVYINSQGLAVLVHS